MAARTSRGAGRYVPQGCGPFGGMSVADTKMPRREAAPWRGGWV
jgi:hypothetical protein